MGWNLRDVLSRESRKSINPILRFNLEGFKNQVDNIKAESSSGDGKKRPRSEYIDFSVVVSADSLRSTDE